MDVIKAIAEACSLPISSINSESKLTDPLEWDSLAQLMIVASLEEEIGRDLTPEEFELSRSCSGICKILKETSS